MIPYRRTRWLAALLAALIASATTVADAPAPKRCCASTAATPRDPRWKIAVGFVVLIVTLIVRPQGILGAERGI